MTVTPDFRSGAWLEASFRYTREYRPQAELAQELVKTDSVADCLSTIFCTMSNRQLRETGDAAARWLTDLAMCEEEGELSAELQKQKNACQVIVDLANQHRTSRYSFSKGVYRRQ